MTFLRLSRTDLLRLGLALPILAPSLPAYGQVRFDQKSNGVAIQVNGKPFSFLHVGKEAGKPFLHPLLTIAGGPDPVTRAFPVDPLPGDSTDSPHHRGLTIGAQKVNGQDFWENDPSSRGPGKGAIEFKELTAVAGGDDRGTLSTMAHWVSAEGRLWLVERRTMTFYSKPVDRRTLDIDLELEAIEPVTFDDQQSAIIGLRLALPFDTHYDGWVANAAGGLNEPGVRGRRSPWLVWIGITSGGQRMGVAILDHPSNLNHPTRWEVQDKGFMMANPFGGRAFAAFDPAAASENATYVMNRGGKLRLRYRILIYPAERESPETVGKVSALFKDFGKP
jgi:hypothetical protein